MPTQPNSEAKVPSWLGPMASQRSPHMQPAAYHAPVHVWVARVTAGQSQRLSLKSAQSRL